MVAVTRLGPDGIPRPPQTFSAATASVAVTGTATAGITEADVVTGGKTIVLTVTNDTWATAGATFDAERQGILDGLDADGAEATGWNAEVRDKESVTAVVRTSDTVVTITLSAAAAYDITADEIITVTVPSSAFAAAASDVTATPTFTVAFVAPETAVPGGSSDPPGGHDRRRRRKRPRIERTHYADPVRRAIYERIKAELPEVARRNVSTLSSPELTEGIRAELVRLERESEALRALETRDASVPRLAPGTAPTDLTEEHLLLLLMLT